MSSKRKYYDTKPAWVRRFYNSIAWRDKRQYILQRDHYMCQHCKERIEKALRTGTPLKPEDRKIPVASEVHHIKELEDYTDLALVDDNLISLCRACHEKTKDYEKKMPIGVRIIKA